MAEMAWEEQVESQRYRLQQKGLEMGEGAKANALEEAKRMV